MATQGTTGEKAILTVDPAAWNQRPGDVQRAVEEIATMMKVPAPTVEAGSVEFPVTAEKRDWAYLRWHECHGQDDLIRPPR